ncbi:DUF885 domain-containing protein [Sphingomonas flavalba]|uniref:DUF885 domain-containing protein n=1 Tax=Sphingomonas flavalba TaxID=2559804 RepID=UPI00109DD65C|nr:DUF885 family protein [Sphingomonas flavalba]
MNKVRSYRTRLIGASLAALMLVGAAAPAAETVDAIGAGYAAIGDNRDAGVSPAWPDPTPAARDRREQALRALASRLDRLPATNDPAARFDRAFLTHLLQTDLAAFRFDEGRMPFSNGQGFFRTLGGAANTTVIRNQTDAENWLARLDSVPQFYDAHIANMRRGLKSGFIQPVLIVDQVLQPLRAAVEVPVAADALLKPFAHLPPAIPAAEQTRLRARAARLVETRVRPAQRGLVAFMEKKYRPAARTALAARDLPDGDAYYRFLIRKFTTTEMTPEEIHALGEQEVARILGEMQAILREVGFAGDVAAFNDALRKDPANYASSPEDYMEKASEVAKRADRAAPRWFGKLPRLTWGPVFKTPEQEGTANIYMRGSPELGVPGSIMMSHRDALKSPLYQLPAWVVHEGVPGHHFQIALSQEQDALPAWRREARVTAFIEGWALYAERLAGEMGLYRDAKERFGRLSFEMYRACRLVMDTGIHWLRWNREQARECLARNTALSPAMVEFETNRYISQPGQALAYKIGELRIAAIRARAEKALGPKFDIRAFHDALIGDGPIPLALLDAHMDDWIARQVAGK